ncbi:Mov34/MPN/PAD-1 family protein [Methanobacterium oryzae]|uniref:Mov34/MPN/PAD-1 family protein n=1 Tax=Methanobacterium oryzae TaxID=69540 RepID=UPI003D25ACAF
MNLNNLLGKILGTSKLEFDEIHVEGEVIDEIINIAKESHPNEFIALLEGKVKDRILKITGLIFLPTDVSNESAVMQVFMEPLSTNSIGSVHSHPGPSASPSDADLHFFSKKGLFHMIIAEPYTRDSIRTYDSWGNIIDYKII